MPPAIPAAAETAGPAGEGEAAGAHGLPWVLAWTVLGAVIPGSGLIAAGWRRAGVCVVFIAVVAASALVAFVTLGHPVERGVSLAVDPRSLQLLALFAGLLAFYWIALIVVTSVALRRLTPLTGRPSLLSWLLVVVLVGAVAGPAYKVGSYALITRSVVTSRSIFRGDPDNLSRRPNVTQVDPWASTPRENVLLIGSDSGDDRTGVRPDTMILASIDTRTGNTVLFSLPRSLQRAPFTKGTPGRRAWPQGFYCPEAPAGQECLLNAIWTWASAGAGVRYYKHYRNPGLRATEDAVEGVTGLEVDTYVMLNLEGFTDFINAIGGLRVNVKERLPMGGDVEHPVAVNGYIEKGRQKLNGLTTLWYARSRWSTNDYDRMQRQRCVLGDVVGQADPVTLAEAFPKIAKTLKKNLSTGIPASDLQAWVTLSQRVKGAKVTSLPFTNEVINTVKPDYDKIHELVAKAVAASGRAAEATPSSSSASLRPHHAVKKPQKATKIKKKVKIDPSRAQDVTSVC